MRKLRLELDELDVASFALVGEDAEARGTVRGEEQITTASSYFTLGQVSCYGECMTQEYQTCWDAGPSVGPSCDHLCTAPSVGCYPPEETEFC